MEVTTILINSQRMFKLIRDSTGQRTSVIEAQCSQQKIDRLAEHFKDEFS